MLTLQELDGPPIVGETYLVRVVYGRWSTKWAWWPVLGPAHSEPEHAPMIDWHLDARFLTPEQEDHAHWVEGKDLRIRELPPSDHPGRWRGSRASRQIVLIWSGYDGLNWRDDEGFSDMANEPSVTDLRPLECRRPTTPPEPLWGPPSVNLAPFGDPAEPIRTAAGRLLCPHQKMDLTHEPRDAEGVVICPLHRLRVTCQQ